MKTGLSRRSFMKTSAVVGVGALLSGGGFSDLEAAETADLAVIRGSNYFQNTIRVVEQLGGIQQFVSRMSNVGLLINSRFPNVGTHVNPDIVLAVVKMCYEAGAKEIHCLKDHFGGYWRRSPLAKEFSEEIQSLKSAEGDFVTEKITGSAALREASVTRALLECDVLINISISKDHAGTNFSCALKNMMSAASSATNRSFHAGMKEDKNWNDDIDFLSQCIADLNLLRTPDLCIADATEFITTNGPFGPGKLAKPQKVVAGIDRVLIDSYCCTLLGLDAKNVAMIEKAHQHELGEMNLDAAIVKEDIE